MLARLCLVLFLVVPGVTAQNSAPQTDAPVLTADQIMARVAANQDRSEALRKQFVYRQHIHILTHKPGGKLLREETTDYDVTPLPDGTEKKLKTLNGRYLLKGKYQDFTGEPVPDSDSLDGGLIKDFRDDLSNEKSKDGLGKDLFPLTSGEQKNYQFTLLGQETQEGRNVFTLGFVPRTRTTSLGRARPISTPPSLSQCASLRSCRVAFHSWSAPCWERTYRESVSTWSTHGNRTESGSRRPLGRNSGSARCSSLTGMSRLRWRIQLLSART